MSGHKENLPIMEKLILDSTIIFLFFYLLSRIDLLSNIQYRQYTSTTIVVFGLFLFRV